MGRYCAVKRAGTSFSPVPSLLPAPVLGVDFTAAYYNDEGTPAVQINMLTFPANAAYVLVTHNVVGGELPPSRVWLPPEGGLSPTAGVYGQTEWVILTWQNEAQEDISLPSIYLEIPLSD